jgi:drug/metabolite transporter (DMT)-like permease
LLRFRSVHGISTDWFSILSFSGVIFGYIYGVIFYHERITWPKLIGTAMILLGVYGVK